MKQLEFNFEQPKYKQVDFQSFNLLYLRKDGVKFLGKRITSDDYRLINSLNGKIEDLNRYHLRRDFKPIKKINKKNKKVNRLNLSNKFVA